MTLKKLLLFFILLSLLLSAVITSTAFLLNDATQEVSEAQEKRITCIALAENLLRSSEMLTRFARTYVATGEKKYREYYDLILEIRNGNIPEPSDYGPAYWFMVSDNLLPLPATTGNGISLDKRMQDAGITVQEFALLRDAQSRSDELVRTEDEAMDMIQRLVTSGNPDWRSHSDHLRAIELLHNQDYYHYKAMIMQPVDQFFKEL
ncbi:MAG: hypothetical protein ACKO7B_16375, partial [Flavobacteriales bacterium]